MVLELSDGPSASMPGKPLGRVVAAEGGTCRSSREEATAEGGSERGSRKGGHWAGSMVSP